MRGGGRGGRGGSAGGRGGGAGGRGGHQGEGGADGKEGSRWKNARVKPVRNLLDSFEADGPGCIKLLNEHGQRSVLTIDYSNPITSDAESGGVCVVTVKVMNKEGETQHETTGRGPTKKLAKQGAAARAVVAIFPQLEDKLKPKGLLDEMVPEVHAGTANTAVEKKDDEGGDAAADPEVDSHEWAKNNAVMVLHQYCTRNSLTIDYKFVEDGPPHAKVYKVSAMVGDEEKGSSEGSRKKLAQTMAALAALQELKVDLTSLASQGLLPCPIGAGKRKRDGEEGGDGKGLKSPRGERQSDESYEARTITRDRIKLLGIYCQMNKPTPLTLDLKVTEDGPPHSKTFTVDVIVDGTSRAVVSASKKKNAQMQAATKALEELNVDTADLVQQYLATLPPKRRKVAAEEGQGGAGGAEGVKQEDSGEKGAAAGDEDNAKEETEAADGTGAEKEEEEEEEECVDAEGGGEEAGGEDEGDGAADAS
eukprot:Tamp_10181.p1 GENE.Tamp_10181~~Tamp_10181.p1  ORF type:complete len:495 (+),score=131.61 Tamp_10181:52-1485(+)